MIMANHMREHWELVIWLYGYIPAREHSISISGINSRVTKYSVLNGAEESIMHVQCSNQFVKDNSSRQFRFW